MDEDELYEAFGIEPEAGENEREPAEPAEETVVGENEQEPAQPAEEGAPQEGGTEAETEEEEPAPMGEEERHRQANARREAERAEQERERQAEVDRAYATAFNGKINPYTGMPITSKAEYEQYQTQFRGEQQRAQMERMRAAGVDPAAIQSIVDQHPAIQQAQEVVRQAEAERVRAQETQAKGWFGEQLKQINALDPEAKVSRLEELAERDPEKYNSMLSMVSRGVSMVDAYKVLYFDTLAQKRAAAAQQSLRNQAAGKAHLTASGGQGKAGVEVPSSIREMYRDMGLDMSDAEMAKSYEEYLKSQK